MQYTPFFFSYKGHPLVESRNQPCPSFFFGVFFIIAFFFIMTDTEKQDRAEIEAYLVSTFSRVVDEYGQQLDITLALPTLVELIKNGGQDDPDKVKSWTF